MIPLRYITEWNQTVPWIESNLVEQDLVISRALVEIYKDDYLRENLAFRGGTSLYKLFVKPPARYSEDIDLVQIKTGPIGDILTRLRKVLSFIEGPKPTVDLGQSMSTLRFRFFSESNPNLFMKLKVEINCREHFSVFGYNHVDFKILNSWFSGRASVISFIPEELLSTKLRALFQRKKGRDLFDLWYCLTKLDPDIDKIIHSFTVYINDSGSTIKRNVFLDNLEEKINDPDFQKDCIGLLHPVVTYDPYMAYNFIKDNIILKIPN